MGWLLLVGVAFAQGNRLFLVASYHPEFPWTRQCDEGLRAALAGGYRLETFYLDTKRRSATEFGARARMAWERLQAYDPDLILVGDDNALRLLAPWIEATDKPVVYFGINGNPREYFHSLPGNLTGVLERTPVLTWLRHLQRLMPKARRGLILLDDSPTSEGIMEVSYNDRTQVRAGGIEADYRTLSRWDAWQEAVREAQQKYDFIIMATYFTLKDSGGRYVDEQAVVHWTSAHTGIPLFANQDYAVNDEGVIASLVVSGERHAALAGTLVRQILEQGVAPRKIFPLTDREGDFYVNRRQLQRFGLTLPESLRTRARFR